MSEQLPKGLTAIVGRRDINISRKFSLTELEIIADALARWQARATSLVHRADPSLEKIHRLDMAIKGHGLANEFRELLESRWEAVLQEFNALGTGEEDGEEDKGE